MKKRIAIAAIATTAVLGGTGAFLGTAASASTSAPSHAIGFTSVQEAAHNYARTVSSQQDKDVSKAGKVVGFDVLHVEADPKNETAKINFTAVLGGGFVYGVLTGSSNPVSHGTVTGGTGIFQGAKGAITAKSLNKSGSKTAVTITYHE